MTLNKLLAQFGDAAQGVKTLLTDALTGKAKFDPALHPKDRLGRWTRGGASIGAAWNSETGQWVDEKGKPVPKTIAERITKLKIPKSYIGVKLNPDADHPRQAVGHYYDPKTGRVGARTYIYSDSHKSERHAKKFVALKKFDKVKRKLAEKSYKDALAGVKPAGVAFLMDQTAIRVGAGDGSRDSSGIGCCDLKVRHVKVNGNKVTLKFKGKSGVDFNQSYNSAKLAAVINSFLNEGDTQKGRNDFLFGTTDDTVRKYIRSVAGGDAKELKPHQYRYWHGTNIATQVISSMVKPNMKKKDVLRIKTAACEAVSKFLNNTPSVAFQQYIDPSVWQFIPEGIDFKLPRDSKAVNGFTSIAMENLFDTTLYPDFGWEKEPEIDDLFAGVADDYEFTETDESLADYEAFIEDGEGFPED